MQLRHVQWAVSMAAALLIAPSAGADPWAGPDLTRRPALIGHAVENFDLAISEVCFPYLLQNADQTSWQEPHRTGILHRDHAPPNMTGNTAYWVGRYVTAGVRQTEIGRECTVFSERGEAEQLRTALLARLAQMPGEMKLALTQLAPTTFTRREFYCGPAEGIQDAVLIDTGPRTNGQDGPPIIVSFIHGGSRDGRCDTAVEAQTPPVENAALLATRFNAAIDGCGALIGAGAADAGLAAAGLPLSAPARLGDTPLARRRDNGILDFFGADARVRLALAYADGAPVMVVGEESGRRCYLAGSGRDNLAPRVLATLSARNGDWTRTDAETLRRANGDSVRVLTSANPNGSTFVRAFFSRGR